jgi:alkylation response protein AidB-like acyl-CoA dehydrogenase
VIFGHATPLIWSPNKFLLPHFSPILAPTSTTITTQRPQTDIPILTAKFAVLLGDEGKLAIIFQGQITSTQAFAVSKHSKRPPSDRIMADIASITRPDDPAMDELCRQLSATAADLELSGKWPTRQLQALAQAGVYRWFLPTPWGGFDWSEPDLAKGYLRLAAACLTTTFVLTQRSAAVRRIVEAENEPLKQNLLPALADGSLFTTVGISHLTTSRRHLAKPVLQATQTADGFILNGYSPWVTGAAHADHVVLGVTLDNGKQILLALPTSLPGVAVPHPAQLLALNSSHTGPLECHDVTVGNELLLDGPAENVIAARSGTKTGGLQTSALAIGLSAAAIAFLERESEKRPELTNPAGNLRRDHNGCETDLLTLASGATSCSSEDLRARANSLALRTTQAALAAAKGAGYVAGHPAGRWCREALFFLVWSCPQPVMNANLCELAGLG